MAKLAEKSDELMHERPRITIRSTEDADLALKQIGAMQDEISRIELRENEIIRQAEARMIEGTKHPRKWLCANERALQKWAESDREAWESKTLDLVFGKIGFRLTPPAIVYLLKRIEHVIERLRAKEMTSCIRVSEKVDKEALQAYDDETLREIGCKRVQKDEFYYEVKREEVKR